MRVQIALSATPTYFVHQYDNSFVILLEDIPKRPIKRNLPLTYSNVPYALLDLDGAWDRGYEEERKVPMLEMISVPARKREKGLGAELFRALLHFMRKKKIEHVEFNSYHDDFWNGIKSKNVKLVKLKRGPTIGHIDL